MAIGVYISDSCLVLFTSCVRTKQQNPIDMDDDSEENLVEESNLQNLIVLCLTIGKLKSKRLTTVMEQLQGEIYSKSMEMVSSEPFQFPIQ